MWLTGSILNVIFSVFCSSFVGRGDCHQLSSPEAFGHFTVRPYKYIRPMYALMGRGGQI